MRSGGRIRVALSSYSAVTVSREGAMPDPNDNDRPWDRGGRDRDDRPRRRDRDRDDDDEDRPRRGRREPAKSGGTAVMWIVGCVLGVGVLLVVVVGGLFFAVQKVRESAARVQNQNNMKQILLGVHNYHDAHGTLPPAQDPVSWRVHILPYIEQANLFQRMDVTQPWDAPVNKSAAGQRVPQYLSPGDSAGTTETRYRVFVGPKTLYEPGARPLPLRLIADGTASTIFLVEAGETVPWAQPKELEYDRNGPLPPLGIPGRKGFNVAMMDGTVTFVAEDVSPDALRGGIEPNDGRRFNP
jgi:hypothetical protein